MFAAAKARISGRRACDGGGKERRNMSEATSGDGLLARLFRPEIDAWRGRRSLTTVFWGYGVIVSICLLILHASAMQRQQLLTQQILILVSAVCTTWILTAIWRTAARDNSYCAKLARGLTVAWAVNSFMVLVFPQLDLVSRLVWT